MHLLACSVLCVFSGGLINIDAYSFAPNLDFLNDPDFPGNSGWQKKMDQQLSFLNDPDFPGNSGWQKKLQESLTPKKDDQISIGNTVSQGTVSQGTVSNIPSSTNNQIISGNTGIEKPVPNIPSSTNDQISIGNTQSIGTVSNIQGSTNYQSIKDMPGYTEDEETVDIQGFKYPTNAMYNGNPFSVQIPQFPKNYPFPPECQSTDYPGFKYPEVNEVSSSAPKVEQTIEHESLLCRDPEYSPDSFYMLRTTARRGPKHSNTKYIYYNKKGEVIQYSPKVEYKPLGA